MNLPAIHSHFSEQAACSAASGSTLFWEGDACDYVYSLRSGVVRGVTNSRDGERQVTAFFFGGDEIGLPVTPARRYSAEAVTNVSFVRQDRSRWREALVESCRSDGKMLASIGAEQDPIFRRGMLLGRQGAATRMAAFLCMISARLPNNNGSFTLPMPQVDIADYLALTPETVCRSLRKLREIAAITMPRHDQIIVTDRAVLEYTAHS